MSTTATGRVEKRRKPKKPQGPKLPSLPKDALVSKRPLLRPAIPSPYAGAHNQKVVYIGAKTPFLSAVKRAEKLLHLSDKRLVQGATRIAKDSTSYGKKRQRRRGGDDDEILAIAEEVEAMKKNGKRGRPNADGDFAVGEEVVLKGTGKAITKVMELGLWFQQREEYAVRLKTGSVGAVDDVSYEENGVASESLADKDASAGAEEDDGTQEMEVDKPALKHKPASRVVKREEGEVVDGKKEVTETRIRQLSVLEVYVSLR